MKPLIHIIFTLILSIITTSKSQTFKIQHVSSVSIEKEVVIISDTTEFSPDNLRIALVQEKIRNPDIVFKQAVLETGHFKSELFLNNNNLFGMKHPYVRKTTSLGKEKGHAKFANWFQSVKDMFYFQNFYQHRIDSVHKGGYYDFLDDIYASDKLYTCKLRDISL